MPDRLSVVLLIYPVPLLAQFIPPSGSDPVAVACPNRLTADNGTDGLSAWQKGRGFAGIEGDGVFGIGNWGHVPETLAWYCKAWAAGNAVAAYDIAEIFREGYVVNSRGPGGQIITKHFEADLPTAFYWYQRSAERGFTKGMLAVAQYYGLGDQVLKGSHVARDLGKAGSLLHEAANAGDTTALTMLAARYAGLKTAPWVMAIPMETDYAKALESALSAQSILKRFDPDCSSPDAVKDMIDLLPDASEGRKVRGAAVVAVHGSSATRPMQADCILSLGAPPPSQQNEPLLAQISRLIQGGGVGTWTYSIVQVPGIDRSVMYRETAAQAMTEGAEQLAAIVQALSPPSGAQRSRATPNGWQRFDMNGTWRAIDGSPGTAGYHVLDIKVEDDGDYITAELVSPPPNATAYDVVLFSAIYDANDIPATLSPDGFVNGQPKYRHGMIHILDADHFRLEGYPQFERVKK
jgi:hypothetical protein